MDTHCYDAWFHSVASAFHLDAFHATSPFEDWPIPSRAASPCPLVATVYDLLPLRLPFYFHTPLDEQRYLSRLGRIRQYQSILTLSKAVREDLIAVGGVPAARISVIGAGVEPGFREISRTAALPLLRKHGIQGPYVMCTGGDDPRKNLVRLIEAFSQLPVTAPRLQLVIACSLSQRTSATLTRIAHRLGVAAQLILTGYVPQDDLIALYNGCLISVFPSLGEGFGMPLLEAMACGAPAVTSNRPPMTEIGGDAAVYTDPLNPAALADAMLRLLSDEHARLVLRMKGVLRATRFQWEAVALAARQAYAQVCRRPGLDAGQRFSAGVLAGRPPTEAAWPGHKGWPGSAWSRQNR